MNMALLLTVSVLSAQPAAPPGKTQEIPVVRSFYRAVLKSPGGELPFSLTVFAADGQLRAWIENGSERIVVSEAAADGPKLRLEIEPYDSTLELEGDPESNWAFGRYAASARGTWTKRRGKGPATSLELTVEPYRGFRFKPLSKPANAESYPPPVAGRWAVKFSKSEEPAVGVFKQDPDGKVEGTFMTATGDYRFLAGSYEFGRLRLSAFDGAHALLFDAQIQPDGSLKGDFWSRDTWHETWTATRNDSAALADGFTLSNWTGGKPLSELKFPNAAGEIRSLDEPGFSGKARIIEVFGTWCPNCNDAAKYMVELDRRYRGLGLSIVGLAFEMTGDSAKDADQVNKFIKFHKIDFPVLIAGVSEKAEASAAFPVLDRIRAYPTTILLNSEGVVRAVHTGFSGPATGDDFVKFKRKFEGMIEELLGSTGSGK